jgi:transcriptional regulator of acetoin/glycerol metabolism
VLTKNRRLLEAARDPLAELEVAIAGSGAVAMLTNGEGVVVHASSREPSRSGLMHTVARIGVPIGELAVGTGAPGLAASTGEVAVVRGAEHFFRCMASLHCAAAPSAMRAEAWSRCSICLASASRSVRRRGMALVYATSIENRLLADSARSNVLLRFKPARA